MLFLEKLGCLCSRKMQILLKYVLQDQRKQRNGLTYLQKPDCTKLVAFQGHSHISPTPTNSQSELLMLGWTYMIARQPNWGSVHAKLVLMEPNKKKYIVCFHTNTCKVSNKTLLLLKCLFHWLKLIFRFLGGCWSMARAFPMVQSFCVTLLMLLPFPL